MANLLEEINTLTSQLSAANANVNSQQNVVDKLGSEAAEYQRQSEYHASRQDYTNSAITDQRRDDKLAELRAAESTLASLKITRNEFSKRLSELQANLSPAQREQLKIDSELDLEKEKSRQINATQGTTKYLIYGTIALVIVIAVIIIIRKKLKA